MDERERLVEALFTERQTEAVRLAWALTGDASLAQELAQEAFVRLYVHRRRLRSPEAAPAYLRRTVINLVFSHGRRAARARSHHEQAQAVGGATAVSGGVAVADDVSLRLDVVAALGELPPRRRACVVLRYYLDLSEVDTAAALGISLGTVKSQTHKALAQLRDRLGEQDPTIEAAGAPDLSAIETSARRRSPADRQPIETEEGP